MKLLENTIDKFHLSNVTVCSIALSNEVGKFEMFIPKINGVYIFALVELTKNNHDTSRIGYYETVDVNTLDNVVDKFSPRAISFIKCDVEGHEFEVFKGGEETIDKYKPTVLVEIWEQKQRVNGNEITSDLIELFKQHNYSVKIIHSRELKDLEAAFIRKNKIQDFLLIPN